MRLLIFGVWKVSLAIFIAFGALQTAQGAPDTAQWLNDLGVRNSRLVGVLLTAVVLLLAVALFAGPSRVRSWIERSHPAKPRNTTPGMATVKASERTFVIATKLDAARIKVDKWIKRGEDMQQSFAEIPDQETLKSRAENPEWAKTMLVAFDYLQKQERWQIDDWHDGVIQELRSIGGGVLGLYSANEQRAKHYLGSFTRTDIFFRNDWTN